jgi:amino-acid N-acetyltransferase
MHRLIDHYADEGILLPRTLADLYENVWEFAVAEEEGRLWGCGALKLYNQDIAEIRSLCVDEAMRSKGIGREIAEELLLEAESFGLRTIFALTGAPAFFEKLGFREVPRERFPTKVWHDCLRCDRYACCAEKAVTLELVDRSVKFSVSAAEVAEVSS